MKITVLRKVFRKQFCFTRCRRQHLQAVEQRRYGRFSFVKDTTGYSSKVPRAMCLGSDGIFCFISIYKFGSIKNPFTMITSLSELYFRFRKFILLVQMKKVISKLMDLKQRVERAWSRSINQSLFFSFLMYIK